MKRIVISNIKKPFDAPAEEFISEAKLKVKRAGMNCRDFSFKLYKRSIDARRRDNIVSVCSVIAESASNIEIPSERLSKYGISEAAKDDISFITGSKRLHNRPLVVGFGPAGMFCALALAENGYAPIVIERGSCVAERVKAVEGFYGGGGLNPECNIQFGAGGAGTFYPGSRNHGSGI